MEILLAAAVGLILGLLLGLLGMSVVLNERHRQETAQLEERLHEQLADIARLPGLEEQVRKAEGENSRLRELLDEARQEKTQAQTLLKEARELETRFTETFENLSHKILKSRLNEFDEDAVKERDAQRKSIEELLKPLTELLKTHEKKVDDLEKENLETKVSLNEAIKAVIQRTEDLHNTNARLASALSNSKGRGDWGELELVRLLEASGLSEGVHYEKQQSEGAFRPDVKINLCNGRFLYIDAKTVMVNLERLEAVEDETVGGQERRQHAKALEEEIRKLSVKSYEDLIRGSVDFVVLYVPRESMLRVALEEKPSLMEEAFRQKIILASPLILMAILKNVAYGWQQLKLSQTAEEIRDFGIELHRRAATFLERFKTLGDRLEKAHTAYDDAKKSFTGRQGFVPQLQKIEELGCKSKKDLPDEFISDDLLDEERLEGASLLSGLIEAGEAEEEPPVRAGKSG